ncbi:MAG: hypothetical protein K2R98_25710 [Gemmataceae bacterium]|nr:hypothetical protein [Gemmataceae bacterium]
MNALLRLMDSFLSDHFPRRLGDNTGQLRVELLEHRLQPSAAAPLSHATPDVVPLPVEIRTVAELVRVLPDAGRSVIQIEVGASPLATSGTVRARAGEQLAVDPRSQSAAARVFGQTQDADRELPTAMHLAALPTDTRWGSAFHDAPAQSGSAVPLSEQHDSLAEAVRRTNAGLDDDSLSQLVRTLAIPAKSPQPPAAFLVDAFAAIEPADVADADTVSASVSAAFLPQVLPSARGSDWMDMAPALAPDLAQRLAVATASPATTVGVGAALHSPSPGPAAHAPVSAARPASRRSREQAASGGEPERSAFCTDLDAAPGADHTSPQLVAALGIALQQVQALESRQARLNQFFSPTLRRTIQDTDIDTSLRPRPAEVSVLFCDMRGFSREAEKREVQAMLDLVSKAMGFMTQNIVDQDGVIGDFHGDATMGFWGWPNAQPDMASRASLAALSIRTLFEAIGRRRQTGFGIGIGIATGPAVAGKIGTADQVKVTVFGPVVNLASRLEGMTKLLQAPILMDEATARVVRESLPSAAARVRRIAILRPCGMDMPVTVSELLPPATEAPSHTDAHLVQYEQALDAFVTGDWTTASRLLEELPAQDGPRNFLLNHIRQHDGAPPTDWTGVIALASKG